MAQNWAIKAVGRIATDNAGASGYLGDGGLYAGLEVTVDRVGSESIGHVLRLPFATYAGLEAEWNAGVATTVLSAAVNTAIAAAAITTSSSLTAAQKAAVGVSISVAE